MSGADDLAQPLRKLRPKGSRDLAGTTQQGGHRSPGSILLQVPGQQSRPQTWKAWILEAWRAPWWPPEASAQRAHRLLRPRPLGPQAFVSMSSPLVWTEVAPRSLLGSGHGDAHGRTPPSTSFLDTPACECAAQGVGSGICLVTDHHHHPTPPPNLVMAVGPFSGNWEARGPWVPDACKRHCTFCLRVCPQHIPRRAAC